MAPRHAVLVVVLALVCALARADHTLGFTTTNWTVTAGQPFALAWAGGDGPVEVDVVNGTEGNIRSVVGVAS